MPIYEYCCQECGHRLEAIQRLADAPLTECPVCSRSSLKKQVSAPTFRLSGGGWYETDFKTGDKKNLAGERGEKSSGDAAGKDANKGSAGEAGAKSSETPAKPAKTESTTTS
jgi:putative FmdB family regulatory protein